MAAFLLFSVIGVSAETAEYSVPNIRLVFAEYSVFGRTLFNVAIFFHIIHYIRLITKLLVSIK